MSQATTWAVPLVGPVTPAAYAQRAKDSFDALLSLHRGAARPDYAVAGTLWIKTIDATEEQVYLYDGTSDIYFGKLDITNHHFYPAAAGTALTATGAEINTVCDGDTAKNNHVHNLADGAEDITASAAEINSRCDGVPYQLQTDETGLTVLGGDGNTLETLYLGTLTAGDVVLIEGYVTGTKGATEGNLTLGFESNTGTGSIQFNGGTDNSIYKTQHAAASVTAQIHIMAVGIVTTAGTVTLQLMGRSLGSTLTSASAWIAATFIKKQ